MKQFPLVPITFAALLIAAGIIAALRLRSADPPPVAATVPTVDRPGTPLARPPAAPAAPATTLLPSAAESDEALQSSSATAEDDLSTLELLLSQYSRNHGGNPVGENEEITAALLGKNPRGLAYLPGGGAYLNASRQLIDRWGTPYFFHQQSAAETEIRSAGPDREFHTRDDLVVGSPSP